MVAQMEEEGVNQKFQSSSRDQKEDNGLSSAEIEENVVKFLDSMDCYLTLMNSVSSTLRQGWLELASARHSMGSSRINSTLFDLKDHSAATTLQVDGQCVDSAMEQPAFKLHKWASSDNSECVSEETVSDGDRLSPNESNGPQIHQNSSSEESDIQEKKAENNGSPAIAHNQVQKQRLKTVFMFRALFFPKLRAAQL